MISNDEYDGLTIAREILKADEILSCLYGRETLERSLKRKAIEMIIDARKFDIEQAYYNLLQQEKNNVKRENNERI